MTTPFYLNIQIRQLSLFQPLHWLSLGWQDFTRAPVIGLLHGFSIIGFALLLMVVAYDHFWILAGAFSGFLLVAPVIAIGLYGVSQALELKQEVSLGTVIGTWLSWRGKPHHDWRLVRFGLLLGASGSGWVLTSAALITLLSKEPINQPLDFLQHVVLAKEGYLFELWLVMGGVLAAPVFASTVVTLPLLLERKISIFDAVLVSWKVIIVNPAAMGFWAAILMMITTIGLFTLVIGLIAIPVLGHASWHVFRESVDVSNLSPRVQG